MPLLLRYAARPRTQMFAVLRRSKLVLVLTFTAFGGCTGGTESGSSTPGTGAADVATVEISHVPRTVYTSIQGEYIDPDDPPDDALAKGRQLTWLFHLVLHAPEEALRIEKVEVDFTRDGKLMWRQVYPRSYLENLKWLEGAIRFDTEYFLENIEFVDNRMVSVEQFTGPDIPAGRTITWVRFEEARPYFGRIDAITFRFNLRNNNDERVFAEHSVPVKEWDQKVQLRPPFEGEWVTKSGNDLGTGHRRTGLNGLTTYGWDFMKVGENRRTYRTDGSTPGDYYTYDAPVLAPAAGVVVHVRNDIEEYGIGVTPPRDRLEEDGDVFAGNLVVIDHGNGEYTLTSHMRAGTIAVEVGDTVTAGQLIGRVGNSGASMAPHIHINMMDRPEWLNARGIPSLFSGFERVPIAGKPQLIERGNPVTGWLIRPLPDGEADE